MQQYLIKNKYPYKYILSPQLVCHIHLNTLNSFLLPRPNLALQGVSLWFSSLNNFNKFTVEHFLKTWNNAVHFTLDFSVPNKFESYAKNLLKAKNLKRGSLHCQKSGRAMNPQLLSCLHCKLNMLLFQQTDWYSNSIQNYRPNRINTIVTHGSNLDSQRSQSTSHRVPPPPTPLYNKGTNADARVLNVQAYISLGLASRCEFAISDVAGLWPTSGRGHIRSARRVALDTLYYIYTDSLGRGASFFFQLACVYRHGLMENWEGGCCWAVQWIGTAAMKMIRAWSCMITRECVIIVHNSCLCVTIDDRAAAFTIVHPYCRNQLQVLRKLIPW